MRPSRTRRKWVRDVRKGRIDMNVQVTLAPDAPMALGDSGPWPDHRVATFVFGGGNGVRVAIRVGAVDLPQLASLVALAQARTSEGAPS
jgi:hypothetical protein